MALPPLFLSRKVMRITYESTQQPETAYPARNRLDPYDIPCSLRNRCPEGKLVVPNTGKAYHSPVGGINRKFQVSTLLPMRNISICSVLAVLSVLALPFAALARRPLNCAVRSACLSATTRMLRALIS